MNILKNEIAGEKIIIRRTTADDLSLLMTLWNDGWVMKWVGFPNGLGWDISKMKDWWYRLQINRNRHHFIVYTKEISFCGEVYYKVDKPHQRASLDIKFIPEAQNRGLATDALNTLINYVFISEPKVTAVWTEPVADNAASQKLYKRCGLKPKKRPVDLKPGPSFWELTREDWENIQRYD
jgi:RimJ/RimL family protein N-acetyltransferase